MRKLVYHKPICIIYNPNSGKKTNLVPVIEERLGADNVPYVLMPTQKAGDTFTYAYELEIEKYSLLVAAGGDGTYHEVINGMLMRKDGKKLPIGLIPNGSGNDLCNSFHLKTLEDALDAICNKSILSIDSVRVLVDREDEEGLPDGIERMSHMRHMVNNTLLSFPAKVA